MIEKLPRWILWGGGILAFSAGFINSTALVGFTHLSVSHVTGNVTLFASAMARWDMPFLAMVCVSLLAFLAGGVISGYVVGSTSLKGGRRYGLALSLEAILLLISLGLFNLHLFYGQIFAAMACGLQNAMVATYSGAVIRTTHLTGLTSDMGSAIGNWLAGRPINKAMFFFQATIWYCFCGGGVSGAWLFLRFGYSALVVPIVIIVILASLYHWVICRR